MDGGKMKKTALFLLTLIIVTLSVNSAPAQGNNFQSGDFENSPAWSKLTPSMQEIWKSGKQAGDMSMRVECFVALRAGGGAGDRDILFGAGFYASEISGSIARGHMKLESIPNVANLSFVRQINSVFK